MILDRETCESYNTLAPHYEAFARDYEHDRWLSELDSLVRSHSLIGRKVLDVACGTGRSLRPLLAMGYDVIGCDVSPRMLEEARRQSPGVRLHLADVRELPFLGRFDWITCLNDVVNYMLTARDLQMALQSMGRLLGPKGLLTFDVNSLREHRDGFASTFVVEDENSFICWEGKGCDDMPGEPGVADITLFSRHGDVWHRRLSRHRQRWWATAELGDAATAAGLEVVAVRGQLPGALIQHSPPTGEGEFTKLVFVVRRKEARPRHEEVNP